MKTLTFKYTKNDGKVSERTLLVLAEPKDQKNYAGIDLSELSPEEAAEYVRLYTQLHDAFISHAQLLQNDFDLKHSYRQFIPANMSDVTEI